MGGNRGGGGGAGFFGMSWTSACFIFAFLIFVMFTPQLLLFLIIGGAGYFCIRITGTGYFRHSKTKRHTEHPDNSFTDVYKEEHG